MEIIDKEQFNLDEEITKLNEPIRYSSTRLKYFYTEQDIKMLFDKVETFYLKQIEEKDKSISHLNIAVKGLNTMFEESQNQLSDAKELLKASKEHIEIVPLESNKALSKMLEDRIKTFLKQD